jgi:hypothetical protein
MEAVMKRTLSVCLLSAALVAAAWTLALAAEAPKTPSKLAYFPAKVVTLKHETHKAVDCKVCHHEPDFAKGKVKKCSEKGCHDSMDKNDKSEKSLYQAFHKKGGKNKSCLECHTAEAEKLDAEKGKALKSCAKSVCHP